MNHPARQRQVEIQQAYRKRQQVERRKEAVAAVFCCLIVVGLTLLFLWSI